MIHVPMGIEQRLYGTPAGLFRDQLQQLRGVLLEAAIDQQHAIRADYREDVRARSGDLDERIGKLGGGEGCRLGSAERCSGGSRKRTDKMAAVKNRKHRQPVYIIGT